MVLHKVAQQETFDELPREDGHDVSGEPPASDESSSTGDDDDDETWDDWVSDSLEKQQCKSLFDSEVLPTVEDALKYDKEKHGFDLDAISTRLGLDFHGRTRLINYIRKEKPNAEALKELSGKESFFSSDEYLIPVLENDPLLQYDSGTWSEDEDQDAEVPSASLDKDKVIRILLRKLKKSRESLVEFRSFVKERLQLSPLGEDAGSASLKETKDSTSSTKVEDDSYYFDSYGQNDIHAIMLRDKVRTATYASFILSSPSLFRGAVVLDVGCGTGILSLFAARAGAKRVFAVDASAAIAAKARKIVEANGFEDVITVINGKIEEITLPDGYTQVDVIVSEWMGYALLYESMLDSVLIARDRFLKPKAEIPPSPPSEGDEEPLNLRPVYSGVMVPSQCRMLLGLCTASDIYKDRVEFWSDVYGYDMSTMAEDVYEDAIIDIVTADQMLSDPFIVKDLDIGHVTQRQLSFSAPFSIRGTTPRRQLARAFILYFDAFFSAKGEVVPAETEATARGDGEAILAEVWRVGGKRRVTSPSPDRGLVQSPPVRSPAQSSPASPVLAPQSDADKEKEKERERRARLRRASSFKSRERESEKDGLKSFTTGPQSVPTHWKQTLFLLREPIPVSENTLVKGMFHCRKNADNTRELDVELHYSVHRVDAEGNIEKSPDGKATPLIIQTFKVR